MSRLRTGRAFQGGFDLNRGTTELLDHLARVEEALGALAEAFRRRYPARRNGQVFLRLRTVSREVDGVLREVPSVAEWRALDTPVGWRGEGCRSRSLGTRLRASDIRRSGLAAEAARVRRFDRRLGQLLALRGRIVAALDAARKKVQGVLRACEEDWLDGLNWEDAALRDAG